MTIRARCCMRARNEEPQRARAAAGAAFGTRGCGHRVQVFTRSPGGLRRYVRSPDEAPAAFLRRLIDCVGGEPVTELPAMPVFAALYRRDLDLAEGSTVYALFTERAGASIAASELIA